MPNQPKGTIILKDLDAFQSTEFNDKEETHFENKTRYTEVNSGFFKDVSVSEYNIPTYCLLAGKQAWPPMIAMNEDNGEFVVYLQALQTGVGLSNLPENFEPQVTLVAILVTNGRTKDQRCEIMRSMKQDLVHENYSTEGHMVHAIDMQADDVLISDKLPYNRWYTVFGIKGLKKRWEASMVKMFQEHLEKLGLSHLLKFVRKTTGRRKLKPVTIGI